MRDEIPEEIHRHGDDDNRHPKAGLPNVLHHLAALPTSAI